MKDIKNKSKSREHWSEHSDRVLRENYGKVPLRQLAKRLGRTPKALTMRIHKWKLLDHAREQGKNASQESK